MNFTPKMEWFCSFFFHLFFLELNLLLKNNSVAFPDKLQLTLPLWLVRNVESFESSIKCRFSASYDIKSARLPFELSVLTKPKLYFILNFLGQPIDSPVNGAAPQPWDIIAQPREMFHKHETKLPVPHTANIKVCFLIELWSYLCLSNSQP